VSALRLLHVSPSVVRFELIDGRGRVLRPVVAWVGSGPTALAAIVFPSVRSEGCETLGDEQADRRVRERAAEELVRLEAAVEALREGVWVA
jgi:hypothetical protein